VAVRARGNQDLGVMSVEELVAKVGQAVADRS